MGRRNQFPSKASIREALLEGLFDPRAPQTPMTVVVGLQDPTYGESKAIELVSEAKLIARKMDQEGKTQKLMDEYQEKLAQAISLLALSKVQRNGSVETTKT